MRFWFSDGAFAKKRTVCWEKGRRLEEVYGKIRFQFWTQPQTMRLVEQHYKEDNCKSQSEFIEKAIEFYTAYLDEEKHVNYLSPLITETVAATIKGSEQHITRILFKVAV